MPQQVTSGVRASGRVCASIAICQGVSSVFRLQNTIFTVSQDIILPALQHRL